MHPTTTTRHPDDTDADLPPQLPLRPCPWCGTVPLLLDQAHAGWFVSCDNQACAISPDTTSYGTAEEAAQAWNTRA